MHEPHLRAADADRTAVAGVLGEHMAAGRLTLAEYDDRLAKAYAARTYGELSALTADLPAHPVMSTSTASPAVPAGRAAGHWREEWGGSAWQSWLRTSLIVTAIWLITCLASLEFHYFWPAWVIGPWGAVLLVQSLTGTADRDDEAGDQEGRPRHLGG
jgi:hypothetical protein